MKLTRFVMQTFVCPQFLTDQLSNLSEQRDLIGTKLVEPFPSEEITLC